MDNIYIKFNNYLHSICDKNDINNFKNNESVTYMLEHVNYNQGLEYLSLIILKTPFTKEDIINYCNINDKIGGGVKYDYNFIKTSPSNFRYIFHSYLILNHIKNLNLNNLNICEVGGGYGGLCLAIHYFANKYNININSYNIIDLQDVIRLQQLYINQNNNELNVNYYNSINYGSDLNLDNLFLISNYCFSELSNDNQQKYIKVLFPKVSHGFMAWNMIPLYNFGFKYLEEEEYPKTGAMNKYVYF